MATIRPIDSGSVHRIHSGQVVLELQGAIKELVENSLDAGATSIEVRIKDNGLDTVEVIDNGSGIAEEDWAYVARRHHTSKLPSLEDLPQVTTFGFRGEALSALCALCESVTIVTATQEMAPMGAVLKLARDGSVLDQSGRVARPRGTTISLQGLFAPLPVRRKEFERNAKKEITKTLSLLTAYALVPASSSSSVGTEGKSGVRLKVENVAGGKAGKRTSLLSNDGRGSLRASVISVWGVKALEGVQDIDMEVDFDVDPRARIEGDGGRQTIRVVGLISSAAWGMGRSSPDRQYFYVNGRPCDLKTVQKVVNETYRSFNTHQVPLAVLDFQIPRDSVDINVSPDKRTIMLHSEANLIAALKTKLEEFFTPSRSTYVAEGATQTVSSLKRGLTQTLLVPHDQSPSQTQQASTTDDPSTKELETTDPPSSTTSGRPSLERPDAADQGNEGASQVPATATSSSSEDEAMPARTLAQVRSIRQSREAIQIDRLDEDESSSEGDGGTMGSSRHRTARRTTSRTSTDAAAGPSRPVRQTISTVSASWSPDRKRVNGTISGKSASASGSSSLTRSSGRQAQQRLRERLKGFASQASQVIRDEQESSEDEVEAEEGQADNEELSVDTERQEPDRGSGGHQEEDESHLSESEPLAELDGEAASRAIRAGPVVMDVDDARDADPSPDQSTSTRTPENAEVSDTEPVPVQATPTGTEPPLSRSLKSSSSFRDEIASTGPSGTVTLSFDLQRLEKRYARRRAAREHNGSRSRPTAFDRLNTGSISAAAGIANKDAETAERALSRVISKPDFARMEILGQFNKGFIITRLRGTDDGRNDDLFIVDQHASDEKFNFETLQRETVIKGQHLIKPRALQLTAGDEIVAAENMNVLRANGFEVAIDEDKAPGRGERISLLAMPVSKDTTFDFKDLEQLLHKLSDSACPTGQMVRCTKARAMFAMRACRKSVMIGKSLTKAQMTQLVRNMGTIDQPWNCPHGRPTMRHLTTLDASDKQQWPTSIPWASWTPG